MSTHTDFSGDYFLFASSQIELYKSVILDVAFYVSSQGGILLPSFEFYLSHENKFYQEIYKRKCNIDSPKSKLVTHSNYDGNNLDVPAVVKNYFGFGSKGVKLARNKKQLINHIDSNLQSYLFHDFSLFGVIKSFVKSRCRYKLKYPKRFGKVVIQEFLPDLKHDWKVLVFFNKVFALKRYVADGDFRASGSGKFDFNEIPSDELLLFAYETRKKLKTPFVSLDIAELPNKKYSIIEYQAVHFGLVTALKSNQHYSINEDCTVSLYSAKLDCVESLFANSIIDFINYEY
ncbi:hypothetical protein [Vibrio furnissii]|uniref:hypothetical protein n=1 Tax=Vibrio furnissii TaxID=29494 RepID=UPI0011D05E4A|nr:hypothetical protein [Vibrio furnissii]